MNETRIEPAFDSRPVSILAVVAFIVAFFVPVLGIVLGVIALVYLRAGAERGRGLAIAAIIVNLVPVIAVTFLVFGRLIVGLFDTLSR